MSRNRNGKNDPRLQERRDGATARMIARDAMSVEGREAKDAATLAKHS